MQYFKVRNWDTFQQYRDRSPKWIKVYRSLSNDYDWTQLKEVQRAHLLGIWLLAAELDNKIPFDPVWVGRQISAFAKVDINQLITLGFLELYESVQNCTEMYLEREREREGETDQEARPSAANGEHVENSWDIARKWLGGPLLGKCLKEYGDARVKQSLADTVAKNPADPKSFLLACLKGKANEKREGRSEPTSAVGRVKAANRERARKRGELEPDPDGTVIEGEFSPG